MNELIEKAYSVGWTTRVFYEKSALILTKRHYALSASITDAVAREQLIHEAANSFALGMATGAALTRKRALVTGLVCGITIGAVTVYACNRKSKEEKSE